MATTTAVLPQTKRSTDRIFFPILTLLIWAVIFHGFSRTYYSAGMVLAPLPNALIHIHAVIFTSWLLLLAVQTGLVAARRVDIHRKLGYFGFILSVLMVIVAPLAATDSLRRGINPIPIPDFGPLGFYAIPMWNIFTFAVLIALGYYTRSKPASHKRLVMLASIAIAGAGVGRFPEAIFVRSHWAGDCVLFSLIVLMMVYDLATTKRVQKATLWGGLFVAVMQEVAVPIGMTPVWHAFARAMSHIPV